TSAAETDQIAVSSTSRMTRWMRAEFIWSAASFIATVARPEKGEPSRRDIMLVSLEETHIHLVEARLTDGHLRPLAPGLHDPAGNVGANVIIGIHTPTSSLQGCYG